MTRWIARLGGVGILLPVVVCMHAQERTESAGARARIEKGNAAFARNRLHEAIEAFQRAIDLDPSSAKAHERLARRCRAQSSPGMSGRLPIRMSRNAPKIT